jgi:iron complex transport system substrate-binding protein
VAENATVTDEKARFDDASSRLQALTTEKPDISFSFIWAGPEILYVAVPDNWGDLQLFQHLGLAIVTPEDPTSPYWDELSWEQALKYPSDVVMNSWRSEIKDDALKDQPTFGPHPAVSSGQVGSWNQDFILSHRGLAETIESVITMLEPAEKVLE